MPSQFLRSCLFVFCLTTLCIHTAVAQEHPGFSLKDQLLQGKKTVIIPFQYLNNFIVLECHMFGVLSGNFILDTGAENILLLDRNYTDITQTKYERRIPIMGSDLSRQLYALLCRNVVFQVADLPTQVQDILVLEENNLQLDEILGIHITGILGASIFRGLMMEINYQRNEVKLIDPDMFKIPKGAKEIPIHMKSQKPYIYATTSLVNEEPVSIELLLDTGSGIPVLLHSNTHASLKLPEHLVKGLLGSGLGGPLEGSMGRVSQLNFGDISFNGVISGFQDIDSLFLTTKERFRNGLIGNGVLSRFRIYLDYASEKLWVKPIRKYQKPFIMDRSGIIFLAHGKLFNQFVVSDVIENTPGYEAGIRQGDELKRLCGIRNESLTLEKISRIMQRKAGKKVRLTIRRNDQNIPTELILRDLI